MTLQISITIPSDEAHPASYLDQQLAALGFFRRSASVIQEMGWKPAPAAETMRDVAEQEVEVAEQATASPASTKRERGKPCPLSGRKRRTREEVEEDEAAEAAEQAAAAQPTPEPNHARTIAQVLGQEAEYDAEFGDRQQISTGEERVGPEDAAEPADIFDEPAPAKTLEDVKKALGAYVTAFGMAAAQTDGQQIFREVLGEPPAGEQAWRMTLIPNDGKSYGAVVAAIEGAIKLNPYKRERVAS